MTIRGTHFITGPGWLLTYDGNTNPFMVHTIQYLQDENSYTSTADDISTHETELSVFNFITSNNFAYPFPRVTTEQRDQMSFINNEYIYNETVEHFQRYTDECWIDII